MRKFMIPRSNFSVAHQAHPTYRTSPSYESTHSGRHLTINRLIRLLLWIGLGEETAGGNRKKFARCGCPSSWLTNSRSLNLSVHGSNLEKSRHAGAVAAHAPQAATAYYRLA